MRISDAERNSYNKDVDVYFQKNAWPTRNFHYSGSVKLLLPSSKILIDTFCFVKILLPRHRTRSNLQYPDSLALCGMACPRGLTCGNPLMRVMRNDDEHAERWYTNENPCKYKRHGFRLDSANSFTKCVSTKEMGLG